MNSDQKISTETPLKHSGLTKGFTVLDCCCGESNYTISAAKLVGPKGVVYAVDNKKSKLDTLRQKAASEHIKNIRIIESDVTSGLPLKDSTLVLCQINNGGQKPLMTASSRNDDEVVSSAIHRGGMTMKWQLERASLRAVPIRPICCVTPPR